MRPNVHITIAGEVFENFPENSPLLEWADAEWFIFMEHIPAIGERLFISFKELQEDFGTDECVVQNRYFFCKEIEERDKETIDVTLLISLEKNKEISLNTNQHFGKQLRVMREKLKLTQVDIAKLIGCTSDNICHFEKGDNTFGKGSIQTVFKYAKALGFTDVKFKL